MHAIVSSPDRSFTMTGRMVFDTETNRSRAVMTMPNPDSDGSLEMHIVSDGVVAYMRSDQFGSLPDGAEWMALDFSSFGAETETPLATNGDARSELELLEAATGDVQEIDKEDVRGVPTTRYRGIIGVSEQVDRMRENGAEDVVASYVEKKGSPLRVEAWIDADDLVRRMRLVSFQPGKGDEGSTTMDMRMEFLGFGDVPEIEVPDSSEVFDATSLAKDAIDRSNDE